MMKKALILTLFLIVFIGCNNTKNKKVDYSKKIVLKTGAQIPEGKKLMESQCFLCHNSSTSHNERIAPPMIAVKAHYLKENTTKEEFISEFVDFVKKPTKEKAKMRGAVRRFGVMPYQQFNKEDIKKIATYIYDYKIEEPTWFKKHWLEKHKKPYNNNGKKVAKNTVKKTTEEIGLAYALGTKKVLGKNLMGTIQKKGTLEALQFCNEKAYPLTDSMATKFNATIKRVSDKPRNIKNKATTKEEAIINKYKNIVLEKGTIHPIIEKTDSVSQFYYPIVTNSMCLQCHGTPNKQIKPITLEKLAMLYPKDKAQNYDVNQVRGVWSITFKN